MFQIISFKNFELKAEPESEPEPAWGYKSSSLDPEPEPVLLENGAAP